jgi:hypothetical protein
MFYYTCIENANSLKMFSWFCFLGSLHLLQYKFNGCVSAGPSSIAVKENDQIRLARHYKLELRVFSFVCQQKVAVQRLYMPRLPFLCAI